MLARWEARCGLESANGRPLRHSAPDPALPVTHRHFSHNTRTLFLDSGEQPCEFELSTFPFLMPAKLSWKSGLDLQEESTGVCVCVCACTNTAWQQPHANSCPVGRVNISIGFVGFSTLSRCAQPITQSHHWRPLKQQFDRGEVLHFFYFLIQTSMKHEYYLCVYSPEICAKPKYRYEHNW